MGLLIQAQVLRRCWTMGMCTALPVDLKHWSLSPWNCCGSEVVLAVANGATLPLNRCPLAVLVAVATRDQG